MRTKILFVLAFFVASFAFAQDVKVTHNLPTSASPGQTIDAQFTVSKGNIGAFAKFQSDLPAGYTAANGDSKSGNFTFENNRVKIVWVSLPAEQTFSFTFKITVPSSASGSASIGGQFYYLENNVKKEFDVPPQNISLGGAAVASSTPAETTSTPAETTSSSSTSSAPAETTSSTPSETTSSPATTSSSSSTTSTTPAETTSSPATTSSSSSTPATTTPAETKTAKTTTPAPSRSGVTYYIQVAALSSEPGAQFKKYGKTKVVQEGGMYKVLVGSYSSLEEARKHKPEMAGKGADGCFVVGYENGVRVKL
ncbi:MAG: SPOR domain-containing protein [Bacteroidia bacterium]